MSVSQEEKLTRSNFGMKSAELADVWSEKNKHAEGGRLTFGSEEEARDHSRKLAIREAQLLNDLNSRFSPDERSEIVENARLILAKLKE